VFAEYAKHSPDDTLIRITIHNRADTPATLHVLPTLLFRNTWAWGGTGEGHLSEPPTITLENENTFLADHPALGRFRLAIESTPDLQPAPIFTNNETNLTRLYNAPNESEFVKDAVSRIRRQQADSCGKPEPVRHESGFPLRVTNRRRELRRHSSAFISRTGDARRSLRQKISSHIR
jgi:hypothetical protein